MAVMLSLLFGCTTDSPKAKPEGSYDAIASEGLIKTDLIVWEAKYLDSFDPGTMIEIVTNGIGNKVFKITREPNVNIHADSDILSEPKVTASDGSPAIIKIVGTYFSDPDHNTTIGIQYYAPYSVKNDKWNSNQGMDLTR